MFSGLRRLYPKAKIGTRSRKNIKISLTNKTYDLLVNSVEFGKGRNGSAFIELCIRTILFASIDTSGESLEYIAKELNEVCKSPNISRNFKTLSRYMEL